MPRAVRELKRQRDPACAEKEVDANDVRALMGSGGDWRSLVPSGIARVIDWTAAGELRGLREPGGPVCGEVADAAAEDQAQGIEKRREIESTASTARGVAEAVARRVPLAPAEHRTRCGLGALHLQ